MNNSEKRVLIISPFFFPEPISTGKFNTDLVLNLKDKVKHITVLCSHPFYPSWSVKNSNDKIKNVKIIRSGNRIHYPKNTFLRRLILELWFAFYVVKKFYKIRKEVDLIIPVFPPNLAWIVIKPFIKKETKTVALVHDLQGVYASRKKGVFGKVVSFITNFIEGTALKQCQKKIFLSNEMKDQAQHNFGLKADTLLVNYPFITLTKKEVTNDLTPIFLKQHRHVVYSGALGEKQNPEQLYAFFDFASKNLKNTIFHFFSEGPVFEKLQHKNQNTKIQFHKLVSKQQISELYQRSSVQIVPQLPGTSHGSLPSKIPNILVSGCKIMVITDEGSELNTIFSKYNLNTVVTSWNNESLLRNLENTLEMPANIKQKEIAMKLFDINVMVTTILA